MSKKKLSKDFLYLKNYLLESLDSAASLYTLSDSEAPFDSCDPLVFLQNTKRGDAKEAFVLVTPIRFEGKNLITLMEIDPS